MPALLTSPALPEPAPPPADGRRMVALMENNVDRVRNLVELQQVAFAFDRRFAEDTARLQSVAATTEQMAGTSTHLAQNTAEVQSLSSEARRQFQSSLAAMGTLSSEVSSVRDVFEVLQQTMEQFAEQMEAVERMTTMVDEIARQTNLLALNASIEAARAGAHGRGFAVVADEVRKLAERSAKAAHDISETTATVGERSQELQAHLRESDAVLERSVAQAGEVQAALEASDAAAADVDARLERMASAVEQQQAAASEVAADATALSASQAANATTFAGIVGEFDRIAELTQASLPLFAEGADDALLLTVAKADHVIWVKRVNDALLGQATLRREELADHHQCRLGTWYDGPGRDRFGQLPAFQAFDAVHQEVHSTGRTIIDLVAAGRHDDALASAERLNGLRDEVLRRLTELRQYC